MTLCLPASATRDGSDSVTELPALARQLLAADDLAGYRRLFETIESVEDRHLRYWASVSAIEAGLAAAAGAHAARLPALSVTLAECALEALEREPSEPRLLGYAGTILHELWSLDAAQAMFEAARRLDPQLTDVERSLEQLAARRELMSTAAVRAPLRAALPALSRRALEIAARAVPAADLRLSLCMIVRDEQQMLPRCLGSIVDAVDEIVVVDTGSSDATVEIARSFGARVIEREWTGSFAEARNVSFDAASGDWVMYLDADEMLVREDVTLLRSLTGRTWREAFYLYQTHYTGDEEDGTAVTHNALRVFRNRREYRFEGRLHEQIAPCLPGYLPERIEATSVRIEHFGYVSAVRDAREKSARNIELLRLQQAESEPTPFMHFNIGCEYAAAGDRAAGLVELERAWALLEQSPNRDGQRFAPALLSRLVKALRVCERPRDALALAEQGLERFPGFTDLVLEQARAAVALGECDRAIELFERCIEMGDAPRRYTASVGSGSYLPRIHLAELRRAAGELEQAIELLERCLREQPDFVGSVLPYASALLADGCEPGAVVRRLESLLAEISPAARFMLATALYEGGAASAGEAQFRIVLRQRPHSGRALVALGETLLAQRRYAEAAVEAAKLDIDDPLATAAARTGLFACIVVGDRPGAARALVRARGAGMGAAELDLFVAWSELASSGRTAIWPSSEALAPLEVMLEALLRVRELDAFEVLHGLLERCPLSERERHDMLAEMYLRRGFVAAAAEQWMAVCRHEPDVRALLGLARVAAAAGMSREAGEFAQAVLACDPDNELAAGLLPQGAGV